jgi:hypothetical protein
MVTGIGYCGRIGKRKREKQIRQLCENPSRFHFYPPPRTKKRKLIIISKDGKKTILRNNKI